MPKTFRITHVNNLPAIIAGGELRSDRVMQQLGGPSAVVGMAKIKQRRLSLSVHCHHGTTVGELVPFYFRPRSIMLFLLHRGNHPELNYALADLIVAYSWSCRGASHEEHRERKHGGAEGRCIDRIS